MDPQTAGLIETMAALAGLQKEAVREKYRTAAGTPYKNPGGRWSKFKSYSTFQVGLLQQTWSKGWGGGGLAWSGSLSLVP